MVPQHPWLLTSREATCKLEKLYGANVPAALDAAAHDHSGLPGRVRAAVDRYVLAQPAHACARVSHRYGGGAAHAVDLLYWPGVWAGAVWADRRSLWAQTATARWLCDLYAGFDRLRAGPID